MQLSRGGMFSNHFITNFQQNVPVKKVWKSVNIWQNVDKNLQLTFLAHPVYTCQCYITTFTVAE